MKFEEQVISPELAKKLRELRVKQESTFYWQYGGELDGAVLCFEHDETWDDDYKHVAAFTVAELGEMLPDSIEVDAAGTEGALRFEKLMLGHGHRVRYVEGVRDEDYVPHFEADTEAEARGLMLAYLIENKLMSV